VWDRLKTRARCSGSAPTLRASCSTQQMPLEVIGPDRPDPQSGSLSDQNVPIGGCAASLARR
jgi:hypothetical protein